MKSPFPGMDPYLEKYWHEVHKRLVIYAGDQLQERLPPDLRASIEQRVVLEQEPDIARTTYPDVFVIEHPESVPSAQATSQTATALEEEPLILTPYSEQRTEAYIEIVDVASGNRVITVIEFLSPTNKLPGEDREQFRSKQRDAIRAGANLVEVDLTRTGKHTLAIRENEVPPSHRTTFRICVRRAEPEGRYELYRAPLLRRLPSIRIPLRAADADVLLDLQSLVDRSYAMGRYNLDYHMDPNPPLDGEDAKLADEWLREKGLR